MSRLVPVQQEEEQTLLERARAGDEAAFGRLVAPYRPQLHAHCYRMLSSVHDAEDALQETLLGAWRGLLRFEGRSSLRSWLYTIATNASLKAIERRPKRVLPVDYGAAADPHDQLGDPLVESVWIEPYLEERDEVIDTSATPDARYEQHESIELAFIAALQLLPARQRAVLILRDVLGFSGAEVAAALETTEAAVYSALQRAHKTIDDRLPEQSQQETLRTLGDHELDRIVAGYVDAWERADVDALATLLTNDAVWSMPPRPEWFRGLDAIVSFLRAYPLARPTRVNIVPTRVNGQLAFRHDEWSDREQRFVPHGVHVLTLDGNRIGEVTVFLEMQDPPDQLSAAARLR